MVGSGAKPSPPFLATGNGSEEQRRATGRAMNLLMDGIVCYQANNGLLAAMFLKAPRSQPICFPGSRDYLSKSISLRNVAGALNTPFRWSRMRSTLQEGREKQYCPLLTSTQMTKFFFCGLQDETFPKQVGEFPERLTQALSFRFLEGVGWGGNHSCRLFY